MAGVMYLGNQMVSPVIVQGVSNPLFPINNGIITKDVSNGINAVGVKEVDDFGLYSAFYTYGYSSSDKPWGYFVRGEVSFPDLEKIGHCGMKETFYGQYYITKISMPKLKVIEESGLESAFLGDYSYRYALEVSLDSLEDIKEFGLYGAFEYHNLSYLILPSLKPENFTNETDYQFSGMLSNVSNCTVYFPSAMQQAIGSWGVVTSGFSGTNTSVIFYIPTKITVNLAQETATILTNDKIFDGVIFATGSTAHYVVYDSTENKYYLGSETGCVEGGEPRTVNIDLTDYTYNKITISTDTALSNPSVTWNGISIPLAQESENVYSVYLNSTIGETLVFEKADDSTTPGYRYEIVTTGEDISESYELPVWNWFEQPIISSNGTIGGDSFAVSADSDSENAYKTFDGYNSTYWTVPAGENTYYYFYNPDGLYLFGIMLTATSSISGIKLVISYSNDGENWGYWDITSNWPVTTTEKKGLLVIGFNCAKYFRLQVNNSSSCQIANMELYAKVSGSKQSVVQFVQPALTSNGTLGGDSFAVGDIRNDTNVYKAFDNDSSTYWQPTKSGSDYDAYPIMYNPKGIRVSSFTTQCTSTSYNVNDGGYVYVGNNSPDEEILPCSYKTTSNVCQLTLYSTGKFYKYYRLELSGSNTKRIKEITINAEVEQNGS